jgi:hypothetical protein
MAVPPTVPYGLPLFDDTSAVTPWQAPFNAISNALNTALGVAFPIRTYKWADQNARNAQTGMSEGDIGDQADIDTQFRYSGTVWAPSIGIYVEYRLASPQAIPGGADTVVVFDTPTIFKGAWSAPSGVVVVPFTGYYNFDVNLSWAAGASVRGVNITQNGTTARILNESTASGNNGITYSVRRFLTAGDSARLRLYTSTGQNVSENGSVPAMTISFAGSR